MSFTDQNAVVFNVGSTLAEVEMAFIKKTLEAKNGNRTHTAKTLNIGIRTLQRKLRTAGLSDYLLSQPGRRPSQAVAAPNPEAAA